MAVEQLSLCLEHQHGDGLFKRVHNIVRQISLLREQHQGPHADPVAVLQHFIVSIFDVVINTVHDAAEIARSGAHPQGIVVAPLDVELILVLPEQIHDLVRVFAPVKDIAQNVQPVYCQTLRQLTEGNDEIIRAFRIQDRIIDPGVVERPVVILVLLGVQKLIDNKSKLLRHGFSDPGTGVFGGQISCQFHQPVKDLLILLPVDPAPGMHPRQFLPGIIDQGAELRLLARRHRISKDQLHLLPDHTGAVVQNVFESLIFSVRVTQKMLCPLGKVHDRLQVDDLCEGCPAVRIILGQQFQYFSVFR